MEREASGGREIILTHFLFFPFLLLRFFFFFVVVVVVVYVYFCFSHVSILFPEDFAAMSNTRTTTDTDDTRKMSKLRLCMTMHFAIDSSFTLRMGEPTMSDPSWRDIAQHSMPSSLKVFLSRSLLLHVYIHIYTDRSKLLFIVVWVCLLYNPSSWPQLCRRRHRWVCVRVYR